MSGKLSDANPVLPPWLYLRTRDRRLLRKTLGTVSSGGADEPPDPLRGEGHVDVVDPERRQRVHDGGDDRRWRHAGAALADALRPQRVERRRRHRAIEDERGW